MVSMTPVPALERTLQQRRDALQAGNAIRTKRALLKKQLKRREVNVCDVLLEPPEWAATMKVVDLLLAVPKVGRVKAMKVLNNARVSPSKTLGGMSARQRAEILSLVRR